MKVLNKDEFWSVVNKIVGIGSNALILLVIAKFLPTKDVAVWFLFSAIFGVVGIIEGGFMQTLSRHITYIESGKPSHKNFNINTFIRVNNDLFKRIIAYISTFALIGGSIYLSINHKIQLSYWDYAAWVVYIINSIIALCANLYSAILVGFRQVAITQKFYSITTIINLLMISVVVIFFKGNNLFGFVISNTFTQLLLLYLNYKKANTFYEPVIDNKNHCEERILVKNDMKKMVLNLISYNLLTSIFYILLSNYVSVKVLASFGLTVQVITYIGGIASIMLASNIPFFASLFSQNRIKEMNRIFFLKAFVALILFLLGVSSFILFFLYFQKYIPLNTNILTGKILYSFLFYITIEYIVSCISIYLIVCNELRLMIISLASSIIILILTYILFRGSHSVTLVFLSRGCISLFTLYIPIFYFIKNINKNKLLSLL